MDLPKAKLIITQGGTIGKEFLINSPKVLIGRWDREQEIMPDIDLSDDDLDLTISRKHAYIYYKDGHFYLEDCNKKNLSFINRHQSLGPHIPHQLENGNEIILGKLFFRFFIENN